MIDTIDEHIKLLMSIENGIENIKINGLPSRSVFEEFLPYVHIEENFKYIDLVCIDNQTSGREKLKVLRKENEIKKEKESMRDKLRDDLQNKFYGLLEKAQLIHISQSVKSSLSESVCSVDCCLSETFRSSALDCRRNRIFLSEFLIGSFRAQLTKRVY